MFMNKVETTPHSNVAIWKNIPSRILLPADSHHSQLTHPERLLSFQITNLDKGTMLLPGLIIKKPLSQKGRP